MAAAEYRFQDAVRLVLPKEHGSWSLTLEPVLLGLLVAPSQTGLALGIAAIAGFFLRRPLKLVLQPKPDPRRSLARFCVATLFALVLLCLAIILHFSTGAMLWPLLPAGCAGLAFVWFDAHGENRAGIAEIAGAATFAFLPAAFASLAGWPLPKSFALSAVMLARSVPTVMLVRTLLRRAKGQVVSPTSAILVTLLATAALGWLASQSLLPWLPVLVSGLLLARAVWFLYANPARLSARKIGMLELVFGVVVVLTTVFAWRF